MGIKRIRSWSAVWGARFAWLWAGVSLSGAAAGASDTGYLRDLTETRGFMLGRPVRPQPTPDGSAVLFLRAEPRVARLKLFEFDVASGRTIELLSPDQLLRGQDERLSPEEKARRERMRVDQGGFTHFEIAPDGRNVLVVLSGRLYWVGRSDGRITELQTGPGAVVDPKIAPDGRAVAYVRGHDVYAYDLERERERPVTFGGTELVANGVAEFIAQEEMGRHSGYWWSPDSEFVAYAQVDTSGVEAWHLADPLRPEAAPQVWRYPRPGKANARVRLGVTRVGRRSTRWIEWDQARYPYLARVDWDRNGGLTLVVQTRDQTEVVLLRADPRSGETRALLVERDDTWVNLEQQVPRWIEDGSGFLWISEREAGRQLELRRADGSLSRVLVPPEAGFQALCDVDPGAGTVVVEASPDPGQAHLFRVPLGEGTVLSLTEGRGINRAVFAKNHTLCVQHRLAPDQMPEAVVRHADGRVIGTLPSVAEEPPFAPNLEWTTTGGEQRFHAAIIRPRGLESGKKYPVLLHVYGGPGVNLVQSSMQAHLMRQWLADQGFVVVVIDGRGTPGRGRDWERAIYRKFGELPLADQVAGLGELLGRYPEMDGGRVGVYGWSYGGYLAALGALRRSDLFKAAVAGAPVCDWEDYDTHYTERYLGMPGIEAQAYREASLLSYVEQLRSPLLVVHGTADDNVFLRHSLRLVDALFRAGKEFEVLPLAGFTHMVAEPEANRELYSRIAGFFRRQLTATR